MTNSWAGYHVLVNPPYEAQVQWRFINRAINEAEWEHCPGIVLVCRNSTDTSYFQRLLPFPRVHLRRTAVQFKDYSHCPIGFGICVFCIVSPTHPKQAEIYGRFHDEFHAGGSLTFPSTTHSSNRHHSSSSPPVCISARARRIEIVGSRAMCAIDGERFRSTRCFARGKRKFGSVASRFPWGVARR